MVPLGESRELHFIVGRARKVSRFQAEEARIFFLCALLANRLAFGGTLCDLATFDSSC